MNQIISVCMTEDQIHAMHTDQMFNNINQNYHEASQRMEWNQKEYRYQRKIDACDRKIMNLELQAKNKNYRSKIKKALFFMALSAGSSVTALTGLSWAPLFIPVGIACGMYAAGITGGLLREKQMV